MDIVIPTSDSRRNDRVIWVALLCIPAFGHAKPLLNFAEQLLSAESNYEYRVTFITSEKFTSFIRPQCSEKVEVVGIADNVIPEKENMTLGKPENIKKHGVLWLRDVMGPPLKNYFQGCPSLPDMIIIDHLTHAGADVANDLGIPYVVHLSWPLFMLARIGIIPLPEETPLPKLLWTKWNEYRRLLGSLGLLPNFLLPPGPPASFFKAIRGVAEGHLVLCTSAFGVEPPRDLPPFVKLIGRGPPIAYSTQGMEAELRAFLGTCNDIVYVSFGSRIPPAEWQVKALAGGLSQGGWPVIWSLKKECQKFLPDQLPDNHLVFDWLPQMQVLAHPNIKAIVTHCGFGGLNECLQNGKPILAIPFLLSADQPVNAESARKGGYGIKLNPNYFSDNEVKCAMSKLLTEEKYAQAAKKAQWAVLASGYGGAGPKVVESAILHGTEHFFPKDKPGYFNTITSYKISGSLIIGAAFSYVFLKYTR